MGDYRELIFYQKARRVIQSCDSLVKHWPTSRQAQEITREVFHSAISAGANIAEGQGRYEGLEYARYLVITQASANETDHWFHTAQDVGLDLEGEIRVLIDPNVKVQEMLTASIKTIRNKPKNITSREDPGEYTTELIDDE